MKYIINNLNNPSFSRSFETFRIDAVYLVERSNDRRKKKRSNWRVANEGTLDLITVHEGGYAIRTRIGKEGEVALTWLGLHTAPSARRQGSS